MFVVNKHEKGVKELSKEIWEKYTVNDKRGMVNNVR